MRLNILKLFLILFTGCSLFNKYSNDRILLDFHLGMTFREFSNHISDLEEREDIDVWTSEPNKKVSNPQDEFYFRYKLYDNIIGTAYLTPNLDFIELRPFDGEDSILTSITIFIEEYGFDTNKKINNSDKKEVINLFTEKYGKSQAEKNKDLIWGFPSVKEPRYICRLDTSNMILSYYYNPLYLQPILEKQEKDVKESEKSKVKDAI